MPAAHAAEREGKMKKTIGTIIVLALPGIVCLTGCSQKEKLPDSFEETAVREEAEKVVSMFNEKDYQGIIDMGDASLKEKNTVEQFTESCDPLLKENGAFKELGDVDIVGTVDKAAGTKYGGAIIEGIYENGEIVFSIAFNEKMELVQFLIR